MAKYGNVPILLRTVFFRLHGKHVKCMLILYILHKEKKKRIVQQANGPIQVCSRNVCRVNIEVAMTD